MSDQIEWSKPIAMSQAVLYSGEGRSIRAQALESGTESTINMQLHLGRESEGRIVAEALHRYALEKGWLK